MSLGFQTWKDIIEILIAPVSLALIALLWAELQSAARRRAFRRLILRELEELEPFPENAEEGKHWHDHQRKNFIHRTIFDAPSENRDFILSLPPDMVYFVSQLWGSLNNRDQVNWLHFLCQLSNPEYDKKGKIKQAYQQWNALIRAYEELRRVDNSRLPPHNC